MTSSRTLVLAVLAVCGATPASSLAQNLSLESVAGLKLHNVQAEPVILDGRRGLRVTFSADATQRYRDLSPDDQSQFETLAVIEDGKFSNGVIEVEIAGEPVPDAPEGARGFVGIAFRVRPDLRTYDAFYLRPTNGRTDDQVRRNHSVQYVS